MFDNEEYINNIVDYHVESSTVLRKDRKKCFVELGKYKRNKNKYEKDILADLILAYEESEFEDLKKEGELMAEAVRKLSAFSQRQIDSYWDDMIKKYEMDMSNERAVERDLGREEGRQEGRAEGRAEGRQEGRQEALFDVAKNLLKTDMSIEDISKCTGLSIEELKSLEI